MSMPRIKLANCSTCKKEIFDFPYRTNAKFCSRPCQYIGYRTMFKKEKHPKWKQRVKIRCKVCNIEFEVSKSRAIRRKSCSARCSRILFDITFKGWRMDKKSSYIRIKTPHHPNADKDGYVGEHRLVMEKKLKRFLKHGEVVHHINCDPSDNRI